MYEDLYVQKADLERILENADGIKEREHASAQLTAVSAALGESIEELDPLAAQWERDIAEGRIPDLDAAP